MSAQKELIENDFIELKNELKREQNKWFERQNTEWNQLRQLCFLIPKQQEIIEAQKKDLDAIKINNEELKRRNEQLLKQINSLEKEYQKDINFLNKAFIELQQKMWDMTTPQIKYGNDNGDSTIKNNLVEFKQKLDSEISQREKLENNLEKNILKINSELIQMEAKLNKSFIALKQEILEKNTKNRDKSNDQDFSTIDKMFDFTGKFKLTSSNKFEEFLEEIGVISKIKILYWNTFTFVDISKDDDTNTLKIWKTRPWDNKTYEIKFELGKEFEEELVDGKIVKTVIIADGNKLVQTRFGDKEVKIIREFNGDKLKIVYFVGSVIAVQVFKRV